MGRHNEDPGALAGATGVSETVFAGWLDTSEYTASPTFLQAQRLRLAFGISLPTARTMAELAFPNGTAAA